MKQPLMHRISVFILLCFFSMIISESYPLYAASEQDGVALMSKGETEYSEGYYREALDSFSRAQGLVEKEKNKKRLFLDLAMVHYALGDEGMSRKAIYVLLELDPEITIDETKFPKGFLQLLDKVIEQVQQEMAERERIAEQKRIEALEKARELKRAEEEKKRQGEIKRQDELRRLEEIRKAEERKRLEELEKIAALKKTEEERKRQDEIKKIEELKKLEELRKAEALKKLDEERKADELKKAEEENKRQEELRKLEEIKKQEELRKIEEQKRLDELKRVEELKKQEELRKAEQLKKIEDQKRLETLKKAEEEKKQQKEAQMLEEQKKHEDLHRAEETKKLEEQKRNEELKKAEEQKELEEQKKTEESIQPEVVDLKKEDLNKIDDWAKKENLEEAKEENKADGIAKNNPVEPQLQVISKEIKKDKGPLKTNKKKFPWLLTILAIGGVVILVVLLSKKKAQMPPTTPPVEYTILTVNLGAGTIGTPSTSSSYNKNQVIDYSYAVQPGYSSLQVKLDGVVVPNSGTVTMNSDHTLSISATNINNASFTNGVLIVGGVRYELASIPAGIFQMGSNSSEASPDEQPIHSVQISKGFWMGKTEVTLGLYQAVMGKNPSYFKYSDNFPVEEISWDDCQSFILVLNQMLGGNAFRLPTEAEWEYACRAGTTADRYGNIDAIGWYTNNSDQTTHPVGQKQANPWGLYDMLGNVWEYCQDWYGEDYYRNSSSVDPQGPLTGSQRVLRGGAWWCVFSLVRASIRWTGVKGVARGSVGFRLASNF